VITNGIKTVAVDVVPGGVALGTRATFLVEYTVAEPLAGLDLIGTRCLSQDQFAARGANVGHLWQRSSLPEGYLPQTLSI
jgi:hypothetical protein